MHQGDHRSSQALSETLRPNEPHFFRIFEQSSYLIALLSCEGEVLEINPALLHCVGQSTSEMIDRPIDQLHGWTLQAEQQMDLRQIVAEAAQGRTVSFEAEILSQAEARTVDFSIRPVRNCQHQVRWLLLEGTDMTQRKQAEAEVSRLKAELAAVQLHPRPSMQAPGQLQTHAGQAQPDAEVPQESERLFATLAQLAPVGIFRTDAAGKCVYVNDRLSQIGGVSAEALLQDGWINILHPDDRDRAVAMWEQMLTGQASPLKLECRFCSPGGRITWVIVQAIPERLEPGNMIGYVGTVTDITEIKQVAREKQESERRYAALATLSPVGIIRTDALGQCIYCNTRWYEISGFTVAESLDDGWLRALHPDDRGRVSFEWRQAIAAKQPFRTDCRFQRPDGQITWVICQALPEFSDSEEVLGYIGTITDITDRKQVEQALSQSEHRYATLAKMSPVGIFKTDRNGNHLYVNERWTELTGLTSAEAQGANWQRALHPEDREQVVFTWQQHIKACLPFQSEFRFQRADGNVTWVVGQAVPELSDLGEVIGYVGSVTDITDRKQAEQALQESEQRYAALAKISPVGIFRCDREGNCLYVNERWCEITGLTPRQAAARGWLSAVHPDDQDSVEQGGKVSALEGLPFHSEFRFQRPDGTIAWVMGQAVAETNVEGRIMGYVGSITDITERKLAEVEIHKRAEELSQVNLLLTRTATLLEERNRELDQFAYIASHDLKAPLRAIANLSEWIEEDLEGQLPPENAQQMRLLRDRVKRMEALINGLLHYSRVGRTYAATEEVSVKTLLSEVIDSLGPPPSFMITIVDPLPTLMTRPLLLRQVFANLIGNAIKHHPRLDGLVTIAAADRGQFYEFGVTDDGIGIAPEHHEKIFAIFHTLESRDKKESTGIGLSIVKKIVETEGGSVWVESQPGAGTTFRFTWPKHSRE